MGGLVKVLLRALAAALLVSLLSWSLVECAPGSTAHRAAVAARAIAPGDLSTPVEVSATITSELAEQHGLDAPFPQRLAERALGTLHMDFGKSWRDGQPASSGLLGLAGLTSLSLVLCALAVAFLAGVFGAVASARRPSSLGRSLWSVYAALVLTLPLPWLAMMAIEALAYGHPLALLPAGGSGTLAQGVLPVLVLASAPAAVLWHHGYVEMRSLYGSNWVLSARASGLAPNRLWRVYILKAAMPTLLTLLPALLAYLVGATVVVEYVFAIHGAGSLVARAALAGDAPVLIAAAVLCAILISLATSAANRLACRLDPRRGAQ